MHFLLLTGHWLQRVRLWQFPFGHQRSLQFATLKVYHLTPTQAALQFFCRLLEFSPTWLHLDFVHIGKTLEHPCPIILLNPTSAQPHLLWSIYEISFFHLTRRIQIVIARPLSPQNEYAAWLSHLQRVIDRNYWKKFQSHMPLPAHQ